MTNQNKNKEMKELSEIEDIRINKKAIEELLELIAEMIAIVVEETVKIITQLSEQWR